MDWRNEMVVDWMESRTEDLEYPICSEAYINCWVYGLRREEKIHCWLAVEMILIVD